MNRMRAVLPLVLALGILWAPVWVGRTVPPWPVGVTIALYAATFLLRRGPSLRSPVTALLAFWAWIAVSYPLWSRWDAAGSITRHEADVMATCAAVSLGLAAVMLSPHGHLTTRWLWPVALFSAVPVGFWEARTGGYLTVDPWFGPTGSPSASYGNPNSFTAVLLLGICSCLALMSTHRRSTGVRIGLGIVAGGGAVLVVLAGSRAGLVCLTAVGVTAAAAAGMRLGVGRWVRRHPALAAIGLFCCCAATIAVFIEPALRRFNVVLRMLRPDNASAMSDGYRLDLLRHAYHFWRTAPSGGIGGGRFETALHTAWPTNRDIPNVHNAVVELLTEYGIVPAALFAVVAVTCVFALLAPHHDRAPDPRTSRLLLAGCGLAIGYGAVIIDSALGWVPWWVMIGHATALADRLSSGSPGLECLPPPRVV